MDGKYAYFKNFVKILFLSYENIDRTIKEKRKNFRINE